MRAVALWCGAYVRERRRWDDVERSRRDLQAAYDAAVAWGASIVLFFAPDDRVEPHVAPSDRQARGLQVRRCPATRASLAAELDQLALHASVDLLFVATNHGEQLGLAVESPPVDVFAEPSEPPGPLTPAELQAILDGIPGRQAVVLATCHAGVFLPLANPRRFVLAASAADTSYYILRAEEPCSPLLARLFGQWTQRGARQLGAFASAATDAIEHPDSRVQDGSIAHAPCAAGACPEW